MWTAPRTSRLDCRRAVLGLRRNALDLQGVDAPAVGADHLEPEITDGRQFSALGEATEGLQDEASHRIELLAAEIAPQRFIEIADFSLCLDPVAAVCLGDDVVLGLVEVIFVLDVA